MRLFGTELQSFGRGFQNSEDDKISNQLNCRTTSLKASLVGFFVVVLVVLYKRKRT